MSGANDPRLFGLASGGAASSPNVASRAPAAPVPTAPGALLGEGVTDAEDLARLVALLRRVEAATVPQQRDIIIGEFIVAGARVPERLIAVLQSLSRNEAACLRLLGWGRANDDIAMLLDMTEATVRTHLSNALKKLALDGMRELNSLAGLLFMDTR